MFKFNGTFHGCNNTRPLYIAAGKAYLTDRPTIFRHVGLAISQL